jgi:putative ABC transport system permease protein
MDQAIAQAASVLPHRRVMLFGISPLDPVAFGGVAVLLAAVAVTASLAPALRAARLDPLATLRRQ